MLFFSNLLGDFGTIEKANRMRKAKKTEIKWVQKAKRGDLKSFENLYKLHGDYMYNLCRRMLPTLESEDCFQESFIEAYQNLRKLKDEATFFYWLRRIVINKCLKRLRKQEFLMPITDNIQQDEESFSWDHFDMAILHKAIEKLPKGCRTVLILFCFEDYSHVEIAEMLEIGVATSKSQLHRAKSLLKSSLQEVESFKKTNNGIS